MDLSLQDIDSPQVILGYWDKRVQQYEVNNPYLYKQLFGDQRWATPEIGITYGADLPARSLSTSALDAKATTLNQNGFKVRYFTAPYFKNQMHLDETRRQAIIDALYNNPAQGVAQGIMNTQLNDTLALARYATFTRDQLAGQVITKGRIDFDDDTESIDFKWDEDQHRGSIQPWGTAEAQPMEDLRNARLQLQRKNSTVIRYAVMNQNTWIKLSRSGEVLRTIYPNGTTINMAVAPSIVNQAVYNSTNVMPFVYDKTDGWGNYVIPDDYVALVPDGQIGQMAFTDTPESRGDNPNAQVATTGDGISIMTYRDNDPMTTTVKVSERCLPVLTNPYGIMGLQTNQVSPDGSNQPGTAVDTVPNALGYVVSGAASGDTTNQKPRSSAAKSSSSASNSGSSSSYNSGSSSASK